MISRPVMGLRANARFGPRSGFDHRARAPAGSGRFLGLAGKPQAVVADCDRSGTDEPPDVGRTLSAEAAARAPSRPRNGTKSQTRFVAVVLPLRNPPAAPDAAVADEDAGTGDEVDGLEPRATAERAREARAAHAIAEAVVVHSELKEDAGGDALAQPREPEQEVLAADVDAAVGLRLLHGKLQRLLRARR